MASPNISHTAEAQDTIDAVKYDPSKKPQPGVVPCYDPATMQLLGYCPAMSDREVSSDLVAQEAEDVEYHFVQYHALLILSSIRKS